MAVAEDVPVTRTLRKNETFHRNYQSICQSRNAVPLRCVLNGMSEQKLDFLTDRLTLNDWEFILQAVKSDQSLRQIGVRSRWSSNEVLETVDTREKASRTTSRPVIYTNYLLTKLLTSLGRCMSVSSTLSYLHLEGLPLGSEYVRRLGDSVAKCKSLQTLTLQRSGIGDDGVEVICKAVMTMPSLWLIDLTKCDITAVGVGRIADLIKRQNHIRLEETWKDSLRYQEADLNQAGGLRRVTLNGNEKIGAAGAQSLIHVLNDDEFVKALDMQDCGLTTATAVSFMEMLDLNDSLMVIDIRGNAAVEQVLLRNLIEVLHKRAFAAKSYSYPWVPETAITGIRSTCPIQSRPSTWSMSGVPASRLGTRGRPHTTQSNTQYNRGNRTPCYRPPCSRQPCSRPSTNQYDPPRTPCSQYAFSDTSERPCYQSQISTRPRSQGDQSAISTRPCTRYDHIDASEKSPCTKVDISTKPEISPETYRAASSDSDTPLFGQALLRQFIELDDPTMEPPIGCVEHRLRLEIEDLGAELIDTLREKDALEALAEQLRVEDEEAEERAEVAQVAKEKRHEELMDGARAKLRLMKVEVEKALRSKVEGDDVAEKVFKLWGMKVEGDEVEEEDVEEEENVEEEVDEEEDIEDEEVIESTGSNSDEEDNLSTTETLTWRNNAMYDSEDEPDTEQLQAEVESEDEDTEEYVENECDQKSEDDVSELETDDEVSDVASTDGDTEVESEQNEDDMTQPEPGIEPPKLKARVTKSEEADYIRSLLLKRCHSSRPPPRTRTLIVDKRTKCTKSESVVDRSNSPPYVEQELGDMERSHDQVVVRTKDAEASKPEASKVTSKRPSKDAAVAAWVAASKSSVPKVGYNTSELETVPNSRNKRLPNAGSKQNDSPKGVNNPLTNVKSPWILNRGLKTPPKTGLQPRTITGSKPVPRAVFQPRSNVLFKPLPKPELKGPFRSPYDAFDFKTTKAHSKPAYKSAPRSSCRSPYDSHQLRAVKPPFKTVSKFSCTTVTLPKAASRSKNAPQPWNTPRASGFKAARTAKTACTAKAASKSKYNVAPVEVVKPPGKTVSKHFCQTKEEMHKYLIGNVTNNWAPLLEHWEKDIRKARMLKEQAE